MQFVLKASLYREKVDSIDLEENSLEETLASITADSTEAAWKKLGITPTRLQGEFGHLLRHKVGPLSFYIEEGLKEISSPEDFQAICQAYD